MKKLVVLHEVVAGFHFSERISDTPLSTVGLACFFFGLGPA
jgi:hypothetical protein